MVMYDDAIRAYAASTMSPTMNATIAPRVELGGAGEVKRAEAAVAYRQREIKE